MGSATTANFIYNPAQQYLFSRTYSVALGPPNQTAAIQYSNIPIVTNGQTQKPSPLRVTFDIDKNQAGTSNKAKIEIYNLSVQTRSNIKPGWIIQLSAGYNGLMDTIFIGNVDLHGTKTERKGADMVTSFECGEGESSIVMARLDKSYPPGTTLAQVLQDIGNAMHVNSLVTDAGVGAGAALGIPNYVFARGTVLHGSCKDSLDKILKTQGLRWSVQNGNLQILPVNAYNGKQAIIVASGSYVDPTTNAVKFSPNKATGLIGTPSWNSTLLSFNVLLNPNLIPGALIQMVCENTNLNGFYKLCRSHFIGDSHSSKWNIECEAVPQKNVQQNLPFASGFDYQKGVIA